MRNGFGVGMEYTVFSVNNNHNPEQIDILNLVEDIDKSRNEEHDINCEYIENNFMPTRIDWISTKYIDKFVRDGFNSFLLYDAGFDEYYYTAQILGVESEEVGYPLLRVIGQDEPLTLEDICLGFSDFAVINEPD